jgi:beta-lactamase class A
VLKRLFQLPAKRRDSGIVSTNATFETSMTSRAHSSSPLHQPTPSSTRRHFLLGSLLVCSSCQPRRPAEGAREDDLAPPAGRDRQSTEGADVALADLEGTIGGRLGVFALDTKTARIIQHRPDERFALCSTFKWVLAAHVLHRVDMGDLRLDEPVPFGEADLLEYAPVTQARVGEGALSIEELARAAVVVSDNTAANLLLGKVGGPAGLTAFIRARGDEVTRLDRNEPALNGNEPGDPRDTTSPRAMAHLLESILCKDVLSAAGRARLVEWLVACETGAGRLKAGLPMDYRVGHKTGSGGNGEHAAVNDVAIVWPPGREPILIASYLSDAVGDLPALEQIHAEVARIATRELS